jgi:hypothetical protein
MTNQPSDPKNEPQNDFWDLGDDDLDTGDAVESSPPKQEAPGPAPARTTPSAPAANSDYVLGDLDDDSPPPAQKPAETTAPEARPETRRVRIKETKREAKPTTIVEKMIIGILLSGLIGVAVWGVVTYLDSAPNGELAEYKEEFPIQGESVIVEGVETWWREPVRDGADADIGVVIDARLIPCASIKIGGNNSTNLQVSFRDGENKLIGDIINLAVNNGQFEQNGSNEVSVHATAGFTNPTTINPYIHQDIDPWTLAIVEGSNSDEPIVKARIEANRKEK